MKNKKEAVGVQAVRSTVKNRKGGPIEELRHYIAILCLKKNSVRWNFNLLLLVLFFGTANCLGHETLVEKSGKDKNDQFRVVGYFQGDLVKEISMVNFSVLTHVNIAFTNPDSTGALPEISGLKNFVTQAHRHKVKVLISIGGGRAPKYYKTLINEENRSRFTQEINRFLDMYQLDGVDVDLEGELITSDYEGFIADLSASLKKGILLTAAVATEYGKNVPVGALEKMDFVNIMSYDKTGPWRPHKPGQHAPYEMAVDDIAFWHGVKGVPKHKLNLGLPFYGHSFYEDGKQGTSYTYNRLVTDYPGAESKDELQMKDGATVYYNGESTIRRKTAFALSELGGIMVWQLKQDATGDKSLLSFVKEILDTAAKYTKK
ncbi:hypothetical protein G5B00_07600 [Parapedobacter sp. SGR-10]|uniref:glycosyl hydrolase family 18 protein n=1 Tax=Parapedobacter sp. SGR-10 TaxID=2710879 RepID=UPI0013D16570|nr:glycosyl hydrolase family 18 protein [Parapedobacter sp. SGR-10]NGF56379.1 hypothetical protein [Parapedobacter sp. SGR-10]